MHNFYINILMFNFGVFYMFRVRRFIFRKTIVYTVMVWYVLHVSVQAVSITSLLPARLLMLIHVPYLYTQPSS